jgi:hypothetical protein
LRAAEVRSVASSALGGSDAGSGGGSLVDMRSNALARPGVEQSAHLHIVAGHHLV